MSNFLKCTVNFKRVCKNYMIFYIEKIFKKFDWAKKRSIKFVMEMMYLVPEATA